MEMTDLPGECTDAPIEPLDDEDWLALWFLLHV
jgi:hypothetical protein